MSIESAKVLYLSGDLSDVRVAMGKHGYHVFPMKSVAFPRRDLNLVNEMGETTGIEGGDVPNIDVQGVYILLGPSKQKLGKSQAYIGHAESVFKRLSNHRTDPLRTWWTDTIVFAAVENGELNVAHIKYIESCLIRNAKKQNNERWVLQKTEPSRDAGKLSLRERDNMNDLAVDLEIITNALGWDLFRKSHSEFKVKAASAVSKVKNMHGTPRFYFKGRGYSATMQVSESGKFVVEQKSKARSENMPKLAKGIVRERKLLKKNNVLRETGGHLVFQKDRSFKFISRAASVVSGQNRNGNTAWKTSDGRAYEEWSAEQQSNSGNDGVSTKPSIPSRKTFSKLKRKSPIFTYVGRNREYAARMQIDETGKYIVKKGSKARNYTSPSTSRGVIQKRKELLAKGVLVERGRYLVFSQDNIFLKPRPSASVVRGHDVDGLSVWKLRDGRTLRRWLADQKSKSRKRSSEFSS